MKVTNRDKSPARGSRATTPQTVPAGSTTIPASPLKASVVPVKQENLEIPVGSTSIPASPLKANVVPVKQEELEVAVEAESNVTEAATLKRKADEGSPPVDADKDVKKERLD